MSFFPILHAPGCMGDTIVYNFAPNHWEPIRKESKYLYVNWAHDNFWNSKVIDVVPYGSGVVISRRDIDEYVPAEFTAFLSFSDKKCPEKSRYLPEASTRTTMPNWRATINISSQFSTTSFQGEIDPFPVSGTMLSICPIIQASRSLKNFLLFLNLENNPSTRTAVIEAWDSKDILNPKLLAPVKNNAVNIVDLSNVYEKETDLPLLVCRGMSGIPLVLSCTTDLEYLSIEHTHPPASLVVHGNRLNSQKRLKKLWFDRLTREGQ